MRRKSSGSCLPISVQCVSPMTKYAFALIALQAALLVPATAQAAQPVPINYHAWQSAADFGSGASAGTVLSSGTVMLASTGTSQVTYDDAHYGAIPAVAGTWTSPVYSPNTSSRRAGRVLERDHAARHLDRGLDGGTTSRHHDQVVRARPLVRRRRHAAGDIHRTSERVRVTPTDPSAVDTFTAATGHCAGSLAARGSLYRPADDAVAGVRAWARWPRGCPPTRKPP